MSKPHIGFQDGDSRDLVGYSDREEDFDEEYWKNIIFLPFNKLWEITCVITVVTNSLLILYVFVFLHEPSGETKAIYCYWFFELFYCIDTICFIMHRCMKERRATRMHEEKNLFWIAVDIISLLPITEFLSLFKETSHIKVATNAWGYIRAKCLVRNYKVLAYFRALRESAGVNQLWVLLFSHLVQFILLSQFFASIFYIIGERAQQKRQPSWLDHINDLYFEKTALNWEILSFSVISNYFAQSSRGTIKAENMIERITVVVAIIMGYFLNVCILYGQFITEYLKFLKKQHIFKYRIHCIKALMLDWEVEEELQKKVLKYFKTVWHRRSGFQKISNIFYNQPRTLQMESCVDVFWEAFRHSQIFTNEDMAFKRELSLVMRSEFVMKGEYLLKKDATKHKMIYIASGVVEILSDEDDDSPIIHLSAGTILGELSCIIGGINFVNVRCATFCEFYTLSMVDLYRCTWKFEGKIKKLLDLASTRIRFARRMANIVLTEKQQQAKYSTKIKTDSSIRWLKKEWRFLYKMQRDFQKSGIELSSFPVTLTHCSNYLNMLVLSNDIDLKTKAICMRPNCPFIMEPRSSFRQFWDYIVLCSILFFAVFIPYRICYGELNPYIFQLRILCDLIYLIDFYITCSTAIKTRDVSALTCGSIILYHGKTVKFLLDLISILYFDYFIYAAGKRNLAIVFATNRLFKIYKIIVFFKDLQNNIHLKLIYVLMAKYTVYFCLWIYMASFILYVTACYVECKPYSWVLHTKKLLKDNFNRLPEKTSDVVQSLYLAANLFWGLGTGERNPYKIIEIMIFVIVITIGYFFSLTCWAELFTAYNLNMKQKAIYMLNLDSFVQSTSFRKGLSNKVQKEFLSFMSFHNEYSTSNWIFIQKNYQDTDVYKALEPIITERVQKILKKIEFFKIFEEEYLERIAHLAVFRTVPPGSVLATENEKSQWLQIIVRGQCSMKSVLKGDVHRNSVQVIKEYDIFPLIEVLHDIKIFLNVKAITAVEIMCIPVSTLKLIIKANPMTYDIIQNLLNSHMGTNDELLLRKEGRLPPLLPKEKSKGVGDMFKFQIFDKDQVISEKKETYLRPYKKLGKIGMCLRFVVFKRTINPESKCFFAWETIRCLHWLIAVVHNLIFYNIMQFYNMTSRKYTLYANLVIGIIDMYVRIHIQYYNKDGLLVTHPIFTARTYIKGNFIIDFLSVFPYVLTEVHTIFGANNTGVSGVIMEVVSKTLLLYRILGWFNYVKTRVDISRSGIVQAFKLFFLFTYIIGNLTLVSIILTCKNVPIGTIKREMQYKMICDNGTWLETNIFKDPNKSVYILLEHFYFVIFTISGIGSATFVAQRNVEVLWTMLVFFIGYIMRIIITAKLTSLHIDQNQELLKYQDSVKAFEKFIKQEHVDEELILKTINFFQVRWRRVNHVDLRTSLGNMHPLLHVDIAVCLYYNCIKKVPMFDGAEEKLISAVSENVTRQFYSKDMAIIRCNDIQSMIFIILKGNVEINIANTKVGTLTEGSLFGNLFPKDIVRQKIFARASTHCELLVMENEVFRKIIKEFPQIKKRLDNVNKLAMEYLSANLDYRHVEMTTSDYQTVSQKKTLMYKIFLSTFDHNNRFIQIYDYILNVYIAPLTAIAILILALIQWTPIFPWESGLIYTFDSIILIRAYLSTRIRYLDEETGTVVGNHRKILRRYFLSISKFGLDLISIFPFNVIVARVTEKFWIINISYINRMLRFFFFVRYSKMKAKMLGYNKLVKCLHILYWCMLIMTIMLCIWWRFACWADKCMYVKKTSIGPRDYTSPDSKYDSVIIAWLFVVNLMGSIGLREVTPRNAEEIAIAIVLVIISQILFFFSMSRVADLIVVENYIMGEYEFQIKKLYTYMQDRQLSPYIAKKIWKYCLETWKRARGEWLPLLIVEAPRTLKEDLMKTMYQKHLENNFLFYKTHIDFLRQLCCHLERIVFLPGDYIVEAGDSNFCMYFIHKGQVEEYEKMGAAEVLLRILCDEFSFGEPQGLLCIPHQYSYKARTVVDILQLNRVSWEYLLDFFPASKEAISQSCDEHGLAKDSFALKKHKEFKQLEHSRLQMVI